jgi:hypothetical protein
MTRIPTAPAASWIDPDIEPAPRATKLLLLTAGGVAVLGHWGDDCVAWAPLPKVPAAIKERMRRAWRRDT